MLQRIQTIYLFLTLILWGIIIKFPLAEIVDQDNQIYLFVFKGLILNSDSEELYVTTYPLIILLAIIMLISLVTIFLYKRRILQMRISFINILLMLGYVGLCYYYIKTFDKQLEGFVHYKVTMILPLISIILTYLAIRAIGKDEALIRSVDRIRGK